MWMQQKRNKIIVYLGVIIFPRHYGEFGMIFRSSIIISNTAKKLEIQKKLTLLLENITIYFIDKVYRNYK